MATPTPQNNSRPDASTLGEGLSNNLLSDLAPLIALFGEQVTKQFLTMSMDWTDNILLALGPLGIMTILVSAIRVAGIKRLKALIGRARESKATAEAELLSSTSYEVCEMWNGVEIVRCFGRPETSQYVIVRDEDSIRVLPTWQAYMEGILVERSGRFQEQDENMIMYHFEGAPNLSLNTPWSFVSTTERWIWLCAASCLQAVSFLLPYVIMRSIDFHFRAYSYACYVVGTAALSIGLALCSHVIEAKTTEYDFIPNPAKCDELVIITVQQESNIGEQHFFSYVTVSVPDSPQIRTSRFNNRNYKRGCTASVFMTILGFICQFVGLRTLHWSAIVISLGFTLVMVAIRAWVRRGLAFHAKYLPLKRNEEGTQISTWIADHVCTDGVHKLGSLAIPHKPKERSENPRWLFTPPRLLTASFTNTAAEIIDMPLLFRLDVPICEFHDDLPICSQVKLCADLILHIAGEGEDEGGTDEAEELLEVIEGLATHSWQQNYFRDADRQDITWKLLMVKTCPGLMHSDVRAKTVQRLVPQNIHMKIQRINTADTDAIEWRSDIEGDDACEMLAAIIHLDACAREALQTTQHQPPYLRIIGNLPCDELDVPGSLVDTYTKWLGPTFMTTQSILPILEKAPRQQDKPHRLAIYGCHYSSLWQNDSRKSNAIQESLPDQRKLADLYLSFPGTNCDSRHEECAREIFGIFAMSLAALLKPLEECDIYEEAMNDGSPDSVIRHPALECIVELMMEQAPSLFPTKEVARQMIIPAFIKHNVLPSLKGEPETPSLGNSQAAS